jgi:hypothetical protein
MVIILSYSVVRLIKKKGNAKHGVYPRREPQKLNVNFDLDLWSFTLKINRVLES